MYASIAKLADYISKLPYTVSFYSKNFRFVCTEQGPAHKITCFLGATLHVQYS